VNESMRILLGNNEKVDRAGKTWIALASGAAGGGFAAAMTTPLDLIKTRLQTQRLAPCPRSLNSDITHMVQKNSKSASAPNIPGSCTVIPTIGLPINTDIKSGEVVPPNDFSRNMRGSYNGVLDTVRTIVREEGYTAFLRGMGPRVATNAPAAGISWAVYELLKDVLNSSRR
jgi:hypothetical protein